MPGKGTLWTLCPLASAHRSSPRAQNVSLWLAWDQTLETKLGMASIFRPAWTWNMGHVYQAQQEGGSDRQPFPYDPSGPNTQRSKVGYLEILDDLGFSSPPGREQRFWLHTHPQHFLSPDPQRSYLLVYHCPQRSSTLFEPIFQVLLFILFSNGTSMRPILMILFTTATSTLPHHSLSS